jgi:acetylglutamate kinase
MSGSMATNSSESSNARANGSTIAIKFGGSLAQDTKVLSELTAAVAALVQQGNSVVLIHGGGKDINANLGLLQEEVRFTEGLRVTDAPVLDMVEMTLSGRVNKMLVRLLLQNKCKAVGISGVDGATLQAHKLHSKVDLGFVGEVEFVDTQLIQCLWNGGFTPVLSPLSVSADGSQAWNVNADDAASAVASALRVEHFVLLSDVPGVLQNEEVIPFLNEEKVTRLVAEGVITGGMIPKTRGAIESIKSGIQNIHIIGWHGPSAFIRQLKGEENTGTILSTS